MLTPDQGIDALTHEVTVRAERSGDGTEFTATLRIDTPAEAAHFRNRGVLQFVLRQLLAADDTEAVI